MDTDTMKIEDMPEVFATFHRQFMIVAQELDATWKPIFQHGGDLMMPDGTIFYARANYERGKVDRYSIRLNYLKNAKGETVSPEEVQRYDKELSKLPSKIMVASKKSPGQIAADIRRRLVPNAKILWAKMQERVEDANKYYAKVDSAKAAITAKYPDVKAPSWRSDTSEISGKVGSKHVEIRIGTTVDFLRCHSFTANEALAILDLIATFPAEEE